MRVLSFLAVVVLSAPSLLAQQPEPTPVSELSKLRKGYVDSLHGLLQQYVKSDDVVAAIAVSQELDRMTGTTPDTLPAVSPCGTWRWPGDDVITIAANGITSHPGWKTKGIWRWVDESKRQFQIEWQDGFVDKIVVSPDGTTLQATNNADRKFTAGRISSPEKLVAGPR